MTVLNINDKPLIRSFTHDADYLAIVTADSMAEGEEVVIGHMKWSFQGKEQTEYCVSEKCCKLISREDNGTLHLGMTQITDELKKSVFLYNRVSGPGTFSVCVEKFRENSFSTKNGILIKLGSLKSMEQYFYCVFAPDNRIFLEGKNGVHQMEGTFIQVGCEMKYLRLSVTPEGLEFECSADGRSWKFVYFQSIDIQEEQFYVGFYSEPRESSFEQWFFTNYIQLHSSNNLEDFMDVPVNYFSSLNKEFRYNQKNPWIQQDPVKWDVLRKFVKITNLLEEILDNHYYVELNLDEYFIEKREAYQKRHFIHANMLYGYDREKRIFYMIGYNEVKTYSKSVITYEAFEKAFETVPNGKWNMYTMKRIFPCIEYQMQKEDVKKYLREYLEGRNSGYRDDLLGNPLNRKFGVNIYTVIEDNLEKITDYRTIFVLTEHKKIMRLRIQFMKKIHFLTDEQYESLNEKIVEIEKLFNVILNLNLLYIHSKEEQLKERLLRNLLIVKEMDINFVKEFLTYL